MQTDRGTWTRWQLLRDSSRRFGEVLPEARRLWAAMLLWAGLSVIGVLCALAAARVARLLPGGAELVESVFLLWAGGWMILGFWGHRAAYRERYGGLAYRHLFVRFLVPFLIGGIAAFTFPALVAGERVLPPVIAYTLVAYLLGTMQLLEVRGTELFWDAEWRGFVYSVFPERGRVVTSGIFQWLRHPIYSAAIRFAFGLALIRNNLPAVRCAALLAVGLWVWSRIEERDLQRASPDYAAYCRRVPAFFVVPPLPFWRYLVTGKTRA